MNVINRKLNILTQTGSDNGRMGWRKRYGTGKTGDMEQYQFQHTKCRIMQLNKWQKPKF